MTTIVIFKRIPPNSTPEYAEQHQEDINETAKAVQAYLDWIALPATVRGYVLEGDDKTAPTLPPKNAFADGFAKKAIKAFKTAAGITADKHLVKGGYATKCGQANYNGDWGAIYEGHPTGCTSDKTAVHEFLHQMGMSHSGRITRSTRKTRQSGDGFCIMDIGSWNGLCAPKYHGLGLLNDGELLTITKSQTFRLMPLELRECDLLDNAYRAAWFPEHRVYLSIRKCIGTPFPAQHPERIYIHEAQAKIENGQKVDWYSYRYSPDARPGDAYELPFGTVRYVSYDDEIAEIEVSCDSI